MLEPCVYPSRAEQRVTALMRRLLLMLVLSVTITAPVAGGQAAGNAGHNRASAGESRAITNPIQETSPQARKQMMRTILARREFAGARIGWFARLMQRIARLVAAIFRSIGRAIEGLFGDGPEFHGTSKLLSNLLAVVVIILFLMLLAYVVARLGWRRMVTAAVPEQEDVYSGPQTTAKALSEAARLAAAGDFRSALRLVYIAALLVLDERELIRFDRSGTNWEYLAALKSHPKIQGALRPVTVVFDRKWYGHEPASESDYDAFVSAFRAVESAEVAK